MSVAGVRCMTSFVLKKKQTAGRERGRLRRAGFADFKKDREGTIGVCHGENY